MTRFDIIAFDADDTLWDNERLYIDTQARLRELLAHYHRPEWIDERLYQTEMRNLQHFGYGIKGFALSMIETAVELTEGRISGHEIQQIIDLAKQMLSADIKLMDHTLDTLTSLGERYPLMLITKGDLHDQEQKVARSGLAQYFQHVEIVSDKRRANYEFLLQRHGIVPDRFLMVGNSLRSDILPVLELGASAVYVPYAQTWAHEAVDLPIDEQPRFYEIEHLGLLAALLDELERATIPASSNTGS